MKSFAGAVVSIMPSAVEVMEGYEAEVCAQINEETERDIPIVFSFELISTYSSMYSIH